MENLTILRITAGLWEAHGQERGWNPRSDSSVSGESAAALLGLFGQFLKQVVKDLSQKAVYLHASYSRDFFQSLAVFAPLVSKATDTSPMKSAPLLTNDVSQSCNEI